MYCPEKGIIGTDLIQEMVDFVEDTDGLALNQPVFDPANPVYLLETQSQNGLPPGEEETECQHVDPAQVMWTSTTYEEDSDPEEEADSGEDEDGDFDEDEEDGEEEEYDDAEEEEEEEEDDSVDPEQQQKKVIC